MMRVVVVLLLWYVIRSKQMPIPNQFGYYRIASVAQWPIVTMLGYIILELELELIRDIDLPKISCQKYLAQNYQHEITVYVRED